MSAGTEQKRRHHLVEDVVAEDGPRCPRRPTLALEEVNGVSMVAVPSVETRDEERRIHEDGLDHLGFPDTPFYRRP